MSNQPKHILFTMALLVGFCAITFGGPAYLPLMFFENHTATVVVFAHAGIILVLMCIMDSDRSVIHPDILITIVGFGIGAYMSLTRIFKIQEMFPTKQINSVLIASLIGLLIAMGVIEIARWFRAVSVPAS